MEKQSKQIWFVKKDLEALKREARKMDISTTALIKIKLFSNKNDNENDNDTNKSKVVENERESE